MGLPEMQDEDAERAIAAHTEDARRLMADDSIWRAVESLAAGMMFGLGTIQNEPTFEFVIDANGDDATRHIVAAGIQPGCWVLNP